MERVALSPSTILKAWISPVTLKEKRSFVASWQPSTGWSTSSAGRNLFTITLRYWTILSSSFFDVYNRLFHLDIKRERFPCRLAGSREPGAGALSIEPVWSAVQRSNGLFPD